MTFGAVILAAGASTRMGGQPKALLQLGNLTFLERAAEMFRGCDAVVVVLGSHAQQLRPVVDRIPYAEAVLNEHHELGQLSSLQTGLRALPLAVDACFFTPVDYAGVRPGTVQLLKDRYRGSLTAPVYEGRHGHPVLCPSEVIDELLALDPRTDTARTVTHAHASDSLYVPVDDPFTVHDVDTPEDYRALVEAWRASTPA